ncbi:MAG: 3-deoxy-manno-octulosonate cytidylyltransferase [Alphaproteobacteria bacterium]|nr:3-deoxy-manno-octulosonate cytidylyltransferase [Alphaproteobacteria bacterium]MBV8548055.1 3-deoxy-manno-octulosonate cytidylyltransferase [Alphaproteobacteria bacterium]
MKTLIVIPARYGSTRLEGKPLVKITGQTMLQRVVAIARAATAGCDDVRFLVATDDARIMEHAKNLNAPCVMTPVACRTGTERVIAAVAQENEKPDFILGLQGDAPLTPPDFLTAMIEAFCTAPCDVLTPVTRLTWDDLDVLRANKSVTPASGTTVTFDEKTGRAFWFSKTILPLIRKESDLRATSTLSPVWRHIGIYGFSHDMLQRYESLPEGHYEKLEGLEQLRVIENGYAIRCVPVDYKGRANMSGVDSPEDVIRAEVLIARHGELLP